MLKRMCFNALYRATPFLRRHKKRDTVNKHCFNALYRATPFLHHWKECKCGEKERFQCPISGHSISTKKMEKLKLHFLCFNALYRATPFLQGKRNRIGRAKEVFQCPISGHSISTLGAGKPHKHWFLRAIFACNSQNILTNHSFNLKIGLLTFCSYL